MNPVRDRLIFETCNTKIDTEEETYRHRGRQAGEEDETITCRQHTGAYERRRKKEEGRRKKEEGRRKDEGIRMNEEGRKKRDGRREKGRRNMEERDTHHA